MAWVNASTDPRLGNDQTSNGFWKLVKSYYDHKINPKWPPRTEENIRKQFIILGKAVFYFQSKIEEAFVYKSGENDIMKFEHAMAMYKSDVGSDFKFFKVWQVLKDQPKWKIWSDDKYKKEGGDGGHATKKLKGVEGDSPSPFSTSSSKKEGGDGGHATKKLKGVEGDSPSPFSTSTNSPMTENSTDVERTKRRTGRKTFKRELKGGSSRGVQQEDLMKILENNELKRKIEYERLMEATQTHYQNLEMEARKQNEIFMSDVSHKKTYRDKKEAERERREAERVRREEDRILLIDLDDPRLPPQLRNEYVLRKQEIISRRYG